MPLGLLAQEKQNNFEIAKSLDIYNSLLRELNLNYVDEINPGELNETAIKAMLDGLDPYSAQMGMSVGYALSVKYTINKKRTSHHFILEYLQMKTFQAQTFDLHTHEIVDKFTSLTFPNIAYRVEF